MAIAESRKSIRNNTTRLKISALDATSRWTLRTERGRGSA